MYAAAQHAKRAVSIPESYARDFYDITLKKTAYDISAGHAFQQHGKHPQCISVRQPTHDGWQQRLALIEEVAVQRGRRPEIAAFLGG